MAASLIAATKSWRPLAAGILVLAPLLTLWNLGAADLAPKLVVKIGRQLSGITDDPVPVPASLRTFADGALQKSAMQAVNDANPLRPPLIRLANQVRYKLFGAYGAPDVVAGEQGQLIEQSYVDEYCRRDLAVLETKARAWIPKLKALQDSFAARGHTLIYVITPSKMAHVPELFLPRLSCASTPFDRVQYLPTYTRLLREAGVRFVDLATLTHGLRGRYEIDVFPAGGTHWNALGVAHAADAVLAEINRDQAIAPRLKWGYTITDRPAGSDRELVDLINVLLPQVRYPTARVTFDKNACADFPAAHLNMAIVGGSFIHALARTLIIDGCLRGLRSYNYLYRGRRSGPAYAIDKERLTAADIAPLADADIVILEENEQVLPGSAHAEEFRRVLTAAP
ncbi:MAG TPA: alginate O-acetyltransferase [Xanthobacteraceae bacterium]|nr:alginate O-acetyltransferase [Xanthobacteraceae bacterium]